MKLDEKDLAFIQDLTTAPQKNITLFSVLRASGEKPFYGCVLFPSLHIAVTQRYAVLDEASDAAKHEAEGRGSHPWSTLFIASDYFHGVLTILQLTAPSQPTA